MAIRVSTTVVALVVAACIVVVVLARHAGGDPNLEGQRFPDLELQALDGTVIAMHTFAGRVVIVNFWATWCAPCRTEMDSLERLSLLTDASRVTVIGVSVDADINLVREHVARKGWRFARFIDPDRALSRDVLGVDALPQTFVIAPDGRIAMVVTGARDWGSPTMLERVRTLEARPPANIVVVHPSARSSSAHAARREGFAELTAYGRTR